MENNGCSNKIGIVFRKLRKTNDMIVSTFLEILEFQIELKNLKQSLTEEAAAAGVNVYLPLDNIDSADRFMTEEVDALTKSKQDLEKKMDEFHIFLMDEDDIVIHYEEYVWELVDEIMDIQTSMTIKINNLNKNNHVEFVRHMLETRNSE